jgi:peptidoglycan-N-acetylglucosamine deacetylase
MIQKLVTITALLLCIHGMAQKKVAITIDDVPNTILYDKEVNRCRLLEQMDSMKLPVAIFINEHRLLDTDSLKINIEWLNRWIKSPNTILGNHGYNHGMLSTEGLDSFKTDVIKGDYLTRELCKKQNKGIKYFRFPYNDLGENETQHRQAVSFINSQHYIIAPFTVHSEDWLVVQLYTYYRMHKMTADAERIGKMFIEKTLEYFQYIDGLTKKQTGRDVKQIYLMHDNLLNADYLVLLLKALKQKGYSFITLDDAMTDPIYAQEDYYMEKPGISWVYRWIKDKQLRNELIEKGPNVQAFELELEKLK